MKSYPKFFGHWNFDIIWDLMIVIWDFGARFGNRNVYIWIR